MWIWYVIKTIFKEIGLFFKHWYVDGFLFIYRYFIHIIKILDREWALFVTIKYLFKPLYQDYSFAGYFIGVGFRILRSFVAALIYLFVTLAFLFIYLAWCSVLPILVLKTLNK